MKTNPFRFSLLLLSICVLLLGIFSNAEAQPQLDYTALKSYNPEGDLSDLASLDAYFFKASVVGMGESTHGTHEFFTNRHRVFKYLVQKHGYTTFYLEADYANCLRVNRYIDGAEDELKAVLRGIGLWPWRTEEMGALIEWMRSYNEAVEPDKKLQFVGCDVQMFVTTVAEIDRLIAKYDASLLAADKSIQITDNAFIKLTDKDSIAQFKPIVAAKKQQLKNLKLDETDRYSAETLMMHLEQIFESKEAYYSYRDVKMGENILHHQKNHPTWKGFYWAHNMHIANYYFTDKNEDRAMYSAGGVLRKHLNDAYLIIGQDFDQGVFNVYSIPNYKPSKKLDLTDINNYVFGPVKVGLNESELAAQFKGVPEKILYVTTKGFGKDENRLYLHDPGTIYLPPKNLKHPSRTTAGPDSFDIIMIIKNTTETAVIEVK